MEEGGAGGREHCWEVSAISVEGCNERWEGDSAREMERMEGRGKKKRTEGDKIPPPSQPP